MTHDLSQKLYDLGIRNDVWYIHGYKMEYREHLCPKNPSQPRDLSEETISTILSFKSIDMNLFHALARSGIDVVASIMASGKV